MVFRPAMPAFNKQKWGVGGYCKGKASLVYVRNSRPTKAAWKEPV